MRTALFVLSCSRGCHGQRRCTPSAEETEVLAAAVGCVVGFTASVPPDEDGLPFTGGGDGVVDLAPTWAGVAAGDGILFTGDGVTRRSVALACTAARGCAGAALLVSVTSFLSRSSFLASTSDGGGVTVVRGGVDMTSLPECTEDMSAAFLCVSAAAAAVDVGFCSRSSTGAGEPAMVVP